MPALVSYKGCKVKQGNDGMRKHEVEFVTVTSFCLRGV